MNAEIVNLRRARKRQTAAVAEATAATNRVVFGASKSAKRTLKAERELADRRLEAHRRAEPGDAG